MVAAKTPEDLPAGWKEHLKVSGGRKIKYYTSADSDKKFYSKRSVIHYVNMKNDSSSTPLPETTPIDSSITPEPETSHGKEYSGMKIDFGGVGTGESPAWLPQGWTVELRNKKTGAGTSTYKVFIDPSTGSKFYSKPEVFRYLDSLDQNKNKNKDQPTDISTVDKSSPKTNVSEHQNSSKKRVRKPNKGNVSSSKPSLDIVTPEVVGSSSLDEVSVGWQAEFKIRRRARGVQIDAYYTDPSSGYVFRSEKDVFCYLETGDISFCDITPTRKDGSDLKSVKDVNPKSTVENSAAKNDLSQHHVLDSGQSSISDKKRNSISQKSNDLVEAASADDLPPGWVKEFKTTKNALGIRKDALYIDPVNGYMFRSKKDAWRYIETGDINTCAIKPKKKDGFDPESAKKGNNPEPPKDGNNQASTKDASLTSTPAGMRYPLRSSRGQPSAGEKSKDGSEAFDMNISPAIDSDVSKRRKVDDVPTNVVVTESVPEVPVKTPPSRRGRKSIKPAQSSTPQPTELKQESIVSADVQAIPIAGADNIPVKKLPKTPRKQKTSRKTPVDPNKPQNIKRSTPVDSKEPEKRSAQSVPGRVSKRLAGSQPEMPANLELSERSLRAAIKKSNEAEDDILSIITMNNNAPTNGASSLQCLASELTPQTTATVRWGARSSQPLASELTPQTTTTVRGGGEVEHNIFPLTTMNTVSTVTSQLADHEPTTGVADIVSMVVQSISKIEESDKSEELSSDNQAAVQEEREESQVHEKPSVNLNARNPQGTYPFLDTWRDPCLDFAFKTLTGDIPVDNKGGYQGSSQNQADHKGGYQGSSQNQADKKGGYQGSSQSQADHKGGYHGTPQNQADTTSSLNRKGFYQSQAETPPSVLRNEYFRQPEPQKPAFFSNGSRSLSLNSLNPVDHQVRAEKPPPPPPRSPASLIPPGFGLPFFGSSSSQQRNTEDRTSSIPPGFGSPSFGGVNSQQQQSTEARTSVPPGFGFFGGFGSQSRSSSDTRNDSQRKY